ncbi:hypothetical protein V6R21_17085 [Limibacter armeniacum]|uniref:hypothetical protein n=1 Tax=Limibacter armeniacum TaxID=466084 RepID=UPI002FE6BF5E
MKKSVFVIIGALIVLGCGSNQSNPHEAQDSAPEAAQEAVKEVQTPALIEHLETAHNRSDFYKQPAISFDLTLYFGDKKRLEGKVKMLTNSTKIRIDKTDSTSLVYDGDKVYITPASAKYDGARFDIFTWAYFFAAPFKFSDPGTHWEMLENEELNEKAYSVGLLTFGDNVGDTPDDWYRVYIDTADNTLFGMAYIVTYGKDETKANEDPHAITYENYESVDGVPIAQKWKFWEWREGKGITKQLGEADIKNVQFFTPSDSTFKAADDKALVTM